MNIAKIIDHTNIKKEATAKDIKKTCQEAKFFGFRGVCVKSKWVKLVKKELEGTGIKVVVLIDPPIGDSPHKKRIQLSQKAKKDGADEIDVVIPIPEVKHGRWEKVFQDFCGINVSAACARKENYTTQKILSTEKINHPVWRPVLPSKR